ncbi:hypothetical protein [Phaeobacter inhibens]|uniref:hypothetical protein n=1 Tax=Phaeobacter inhibens TaxID=221822 RepID=UPI0021A77852|nr:hypothetical protein [Phaeobacter inhibens]UWR47266.1 hypothetical protein K4F86_19005 [Phaeobacter inhibens]UWR62578.1 hypothetical protein K4F88_18730 [Phaeobacter inhibens]UWR82290.1 hypothetical protein K4K97_17965 [Phaeobacter inhibens]
MTDILCREPNTVMRLARLGSMHQSRLSFMRVLTRRLAREGWRFEQTAFEIDEMGQGHAVYTAHGPERSYSLVAFAHDLPPEKRSDRVIAEAWDATFTLYDGVPTDVDIARLSQNIPVQEAGRVSGSELSVSRANRSVRLWEHVVSALASGKQPSAEQIDAVGYLMRTTAVYGSGKLGAADREMIAERPEFRAPFQVEMLSVYLTRWFVTDLVQHMADCRARVKGTTAVRLAPELARSMGIGNSTGLGMAPFLLNHPVLFNNWVAAREKAIQAVRNIEEAHPDDIALFRSLVERSKMTIADWQSEHPIQIQKLSALRSDADQVTSYLEIQTLAGPKPWDVLYRWAEETLSLEGQEWIASLMLEPYGGLVDGFAEDMSADNTATFRIAGAMTIGDLRKILCDVYAWAIDTNWQTPANKARAWYVSEEKLEPRLGERFEEPIEEYEQPLAPGRDAAMLYQALAHWPDEAQVADFLLRHSEHRHVLRRAQIVGRAPYAEIRDNTISDQVLPIDMLRCKLAFFGATKFDPRSDRWVRICMYGNAPLPTELTAENAEFWVFPELEEGAA